METTASIADSLSSKNCCRLSRDWLWKLVGIDDLIQTNNLVQLPHVPWHIGTKKFVKLENCIFFVKTITKSKCVVSLNTWIDFTYFFPICFKIFWCQSTKIWVTKLSGSLQNWRPFDSLPHQFWLPFCLLWKISF